MVEGAPALRRELRLWHLVLFNISAVAGIRWLAAAAHAGPGSLTLWLLAVLAFLIPSALVVSSLSERFPEEGGFYIWTKRAFGEWHGFQCAWLYVLSNIIYFPTLLLSGVAMASYMFGASGVRYSESALFAIPATFLALWLSFLAHLVGLRVGKWTSVLGGASTYLIAALLVAFALLVFWRHGSATHFQLVPQPSFENLNLWSQIAFAMVGLEVAPILGGEIYHPRQTVPRAAWISGAASAVFYIAGTAALLVLMPPAGINIMTGLAQAGQIASARFGTTWLAPCFALLITVGVIGQLSVFIAGNTRVPFALGLDRYLPAAPGEPPSALAYALRVDSRARRAVQRFSPADAARREPARHLPDPGGHDRDRHADSLRLHFRERIPLRPALGGRFGNAGFGGGHPALHQPAARSRICLAVRVESRGWHHSLGAGRLADLCAEQSARGMTYAESVQFLYSLGNEVQTAKLGLERITRLLDALGNPQNAFRSVHVAGTNGKGSTCAMIEAGLRAAGVRTGLYISPHLVEPTERIQIGGQPVSQQRFADAFDASPRNR